MAKRKKRAKVRPKKRAKLPRRSAAARSKGRKVSKLARAKATKRTVATAGPKRAGAKKAARKEVRRMKQPVAAAETVVVDEPAPAA